jgi:nucleoside-triphosphatase THEP1
VPGAPPRLLLEGRPGAGKTTAVARVVELVRADGGSVTGFLTRELRERGERVGFALETLDGRRGMLAHVRVRGPTWAATVSPSTTSSALRSQQCTPTRMSSW